MIDRELLDEIVDLLVETVCSARTTIRIAGDDYPADLVKSKLMKLNSSHMEFVFDCISKNTTEIRNIKKYLLAVLLTPHHQRLLHGPGGPRYEHRQNLKKEDIPMKQGTLIFDEQADRYDIRFDLADYYGGLHCGETFDVLVGGRWRPTRIEMAENWYLVGIRTDDLSGLRVRI